MAIARTGPLVQAISGQVGGVIFADTKRGAQLKKLPSQKRTPSATQLKRQADFARASQEWADSSTESKLHWNAIASHITTSNRLGQSRPMSGRTAWLRFYSTYYVAFADTPAALPVAASPPFHYAVTWFLDATHLEATIDFGSTTQSISTTLYAVRHYSTKSLKRVQYTKIFSVQLSESTPSYDWYATKMDDTIGMPAAGELLTLRFVMLFSEPRFANIHVDLQTISF